MLNRGAYTVVYIVQQTFRLTRSVSIDKSTIRDNIEFRVLKSSWMYNMHAIEETEKHQQLSITIHVLVWKHWTVGYKPLISQLEK